MKIQRESSPCGLCLCVVSNAPPDISKVSVLVEVILSTHSLLCELKWNVLIFWSWGVCQMEQDQDKETSSVTAVFVQASSDKGPG